MTERETVLQLLGEATSPVATLALARKVYGQGTPKKKINGLLHDMRKEGIISVQYNERGGDPRWSLVKEK